MTGRQTTTLLGDTFETVLAAARTNAPWAFERLYHAYAPSVLGFLRGRGAEDPEGLTNEVFLSAFHKLSSFSGGEPQWRSWLFTIAANRVIDDRRRRARRPQPSDAEVPDLPTAAGAEEEALARVGEERVVALLDRLAPDQRTVLLLRILGDLTIEQIADAVGKRPGAVKALQRRGLAALRKLLETDPYP